jgi:hypothetical protein
MLSRHLGGQICSAIPKRVPLTMSLTESEFLVLRQTIASRGTVRMSLLPITMLGWAVMATLLLLFSDLPVTALFTLAILVGGFEAIHALHAGVERVGRYLQVFHEGTAGGPGWESAAMAVGPALPGGGIDPLFTAVFAAATTLNMLPALTPGPTGVELGVVGIFHVVFLLRIVRARGAAARQRAVELESFRALKARLGG